MNLFTPLWLCWGVVFLVIEGTALWSKISKKSKGNGTLSALVWRFIGPGHVFRRIGLALGWVVLTSHFFFQFP